VEVDEPLVLCCLLWAVPGQADAMSAYEDEVQVFRFASRAP
jgi:hypothetical protein